MLLLCGSSFRLDFFPCVLYDWLASVHCIDVFNTGARTFLPGNPGPGKIKNGSSHLVLTCCDARFMLWKLLLCMIYIKITNLKVTWYNLKWKYRDIFSGAVSSRQPAAFTGFMLIILHQVKSWPTAGDSAYVKCNVLAAAASMPWESPTCMWSLVENVFKDHTCKYRKYHHTHHRSCLSAEDYAALRGGQRCSVSRGKSCPWL